MRRQHSAGRDSVDYEAGEVAEPPPLARGGWDLKPGPGSTGAREGRYGGGISRTASLPLGRGPPPEALPMAPDFPGPPPLHRSVSHPVVRPVSPLQRPLNGPLANGGSLAEVSRGALIEEQHHRSSSFPVAYTPLPHHLVSQPSHSMPPGIMTRRAEVPSPPVPPLLASPALPDFAQPAADGGAPSPAPRPVEFALPGSATPGRQQAPTQQPADAEPEAGELSTPAGSVGGDANATPVSDDPPKRKRLGWGQGLARLRSVDKRGLPDDHSEQHSPRDSEASRHTDTARDSPALHSPSFSVRADDAAASAAFPADVLTPGAAIADQPAGLAVPEPPALLMVEPAVVIEAPAAAAAASAAVPSPPPLLPAMGDALGRKIKDEEEPGAAALASPSRPCERLGAAAATSSSEALAAAISSGSEKLLAAGAPAASKEPSPVKQEAAVPHVAPEPASAAAEPEAQPAQLQPSKEVIMRRIDNADGAIEALERRVAELSAALDADVAAEQHLAEDIAHLETATPMEVAPSEGESSIAPSVQVRRMHSCSRSAFLQDPAASKRAAQHAQTFSSCREG